MIQFNYTYLVCQNCGDIIGTKKEDQISYNPSEVNSISQEIHKDSVLLTLQCKKCGCTIQVIT